MHGRLSDLSSDITLRTLERDQWRSEAQKLKRQFDQKMASGNLGTWVSRGDPCPASPNDDQVDGQNSNETCVTHAVGEIEYEDTEEHGRDVQVVR